ncbi:MAG: hypothetical protein KatS3mg077_2404 [Candidatus Binatia bacterium]|nr:MAG: hypothetical protein KatS3mg077_2404 [Candidatus Binatia bacterium]
MCIAGSRFVSIHMRRGQSKAASGRVQRGLHLVACVSAPAVTGAVPDGIGQSRVSLRRVVTRCAASSLCAMLLLVGWMRVGQAQELPPAVANLEVIPANSLVIPMDNDKQNIGAPFNLKAYGLVQRLLKAQIPVKWVIRAGKEKDGVDFTATAERVLPTALAPALLEFRGGPFVVDASFASQALAVAFGYGNDVAVYRTTQAVQADVRFTLRQRAFVFVANDDNNAPIHTAILSAAGFTAGEDYAVLDRPTTSAQLNGNLCATIVTEPHYDGTKDPNYGTVVQAVRGFLLSGGNVLAQCKAVESYENHSSGHFQTTAGIVKPDDPKTGFVYLAPDLPFSQFDGPLADRGGAIPRYSLASGSSFQNGGHVHVEHAGSGAGRYKASVSKLGNDVGSLVFYLAGHEYRSSSLAELNGRRMYLNAVFHPARRPSHCGFDLPTLTPTPSRTATPTSSPTATPSFTATAVPTFTPTNGGATSPTATPTGPVPTPVGSVSTPFPLTPTPLWTPTATISTPPATPTATRTFTRTPSLTPTPTSTPNPCGNGELDPGEECDDGNNDNGDCCSATCRIDPPGSPCDDGLDCTEGDQCDGFGICRSEPSTGQYAILRWSESDPLGSFATVIGQRSLVSGHVCTDITRLLRRSRVLGDLVGLMTSGNSVLLGKRALVAGTLVTAGGAVVGTQNATIGEFLGADSSGSAAQLTECSEARARTAAVRQALLGLPTRAEFSFPATKVRLRKTLRLPQTGELGSGTPVIDFEELKIGSSGRLELVGGPTTESVVIRVRNDFRLGRRAKVLLTGLGPQQVVFVVGGRTNLGGSSYLPATLIGSDRIAVRRRAKIRGGLFGKTVIVAGSAQVQRAAWNGWCLIP